MPVTVETYATAAEAARALSGGTYLGGGTLVMRAVNHADPAVTRILRTGDPALSGVRAGSARVEIGAATTMAEVLEARELEPLWPAARAVGGPAVRAAATVGGNLFAPYPYGDFAVALLALDASVRLADGREQALTDLLAARGRPTGIVAAVSVPRPGPELRFAKVTRVKPKGVSVMSMAAWLPLSGGRVSGARIAYGAMGPTPIRMPAVERALEGRALDPAGIAPALAAATQGIEPPSCTIASGWYRREVAPVHLRRLLLGERP